MNRPPIRLIAGPTASGKSALALALAREIGGEIVGADSMQLYAGLRVLTAGPSETDLAGRPHHLFGVADPAEPWSVGRWLTAALETIGEIAGRGRPAILVGGTGLYFRALTQGLAQIPAVPAGVRSEVAALWSEIGEAAFRARLAEVDPAAEARIAPADRQRLTRALEVQTASGRALTDWQADTRPPLPRAAWRGVVLTLPRAALYARIETRLEAMAAGGGRAEVAALLARDLAPGLPAMKALGVASFAAELAGRLTPAAALADAKQATRRYAKRQIAWFNTQTPDWPRLDARAGVAELAARAR